MCRWRGILDWGRGCRLRSTWPFTVCQRITESLSNYTMYPGGRTGIICFLDMSGFSSCLLLYTCIIFSKFWLCMDTLSPSRLDSPWEGALWKFWTQGLPSGQESLFPLQRLSTCPVSCCPHCLWLIRHGTVQSLRSEHFKSKLHVHLDSVQEHGMTCTNIHSNTLYPQGTSWLGY